MSIIEEKKVDFISTTKDGQCVKLTISDHLNWDEPQQHLLTLQKKINTYLQFIESGELIEKYPNAKDKKVVIFLITKYNIPDKYHEIFNKIKSTIKDAGFNFQTEVLT